MTRNNNISISPLFGVLVVLLIIISVACSNSLRRVQARYLTDIEMGVLPTSFESGTSDIRTDVKGPCYQNESYEVDTNRLVDYPMRYVRINIHWMNSEDSLQSIPEAEARAYTLRLVDAMNYALRNNKKMFLPPRNTTPVHPTNFRYVLTGRPDDPEDDGIYYHYDDSLYYYVHYRKKDSNLYDRGAIEKYGVQLDTVLNLFMMPHQPDSVASPTYSAGRVGVALRNALKVAAKWKQDFEKDPKKCHWRYRGVINHEVGHIMGLSHAWGRSDGCDDTPVHPNRCWSKNSRPGCDTMASNNVMDYTSVQLAWTPCQISRVQRSLSDPRRRQRKFLEPRWCVRNPELDLLIEDEVVWNCMHDLHGNLTIAPGARLTIKCRTSVPQDGTITIQAGGELIIDGGALHQDCGGTWEGVVVEKVGELEGKLTMINSGRILDVLPDEGL